MLTRALLLIVALVVSLVAVFSWSYTGSIASVEVEEKVIALTFDDGPNPPYTQAMLDTLEKAGIKATFFLMGRHAEAFPDQVKAIADAGHEVANHSYSHRLMLASTKSVALEELQRTNALLENITGHKPIHFRPPYGMQGPGAKLALEQLGLRSILMNVNGSDWEHTSPEPIANAVLESITPGSIVLLHDGQGDVDDPMAQDSRSASVEATAIIIKSLQNQGYRFVTVSDLLQLAAATDD